MCIYCTYNSMNVCKWCMSGSATENSILLSVLPRLNKVFNQSINIRHVNGINMLRWEDDLLTYSFSVARSSGVFLGLSLMPTASAIDDSLDLSLFFFLAALAFCVFCDEPFTASPILASKNSDRLEPKLIKPSVIEQVTHIKIVLSFPFCQFSFNYVWHSWF